MADRWMDDRDRQWRDRDWRQSERSGRGQERQSGGGRSGEDRSFGADRDRVFGEQDTGAAYNRPQSGGGGYGAGGTYGGGESYGRGAGGGSSRGGHDQQGDYRGGQDGRHAHGSEWQDRNYGGVSPAMAHGEYDADRGGGQQQVGRQGGGQRFGSQDYTQGGRFYGDDQRQPIYREEWGQGGVDYANAPRGYDAGRGSGGYQGGRQGGGYQGGQQYGGAQGYDRGYQARPAYGGTASGGTGGYDYERGYGDPGREGGRGGWNDRGGDFGDRAREAGNEAGDFLSRAGQKITNWFRGDHLMEGSRGPEDRSYQTDFGRERRYMPEDRGFRGQGPKGYRRSDERINEEVHERLTDDSWLDASNIDVHVKDGEVTLTGSVENRQAKHRAEQLVEDLSGVKHVQNNLRVLSGNPLTGSGRGYGDSVLEKQMSEHDPATGGANGASSTTTTTGNGQASSTEDSAATRTTTRRT